MPRRRVYDITPLRIRILDRISLRVGLGISREEAGGVEGGGFVEWADEVAVEGVHEDVGVVELDGDDGELAVDAELGAEFLCAHHL